MNDQLGNKLFRTAVAKPRLAEGKASSTFFGLTRLRQAYGAQAQRAGRIAPRPLVGLLL